MKVSQHLWFEKDMEAAIRFYTSLIPGSSVGWVSAIPADTPSGPAGSVKLAGFTLGDQRYMAIEAGPLDPFNHAFSIVVECETQAVHARRRACEATHRVALAPQAWDQRGADVAGHAGDQDPHGLRGYEGHRDRPAPGAKTRRMRGRPPAPTEKHACFARVSGKATRSVRNAGSRVACRWPAVFSPARSVNAS